MRVQAERTSRASSSQVTVPLTQATLDLSCFFFFVLVFTTPKNFLVEPTDLTSGQTGQQTVASDFVGNVNSQAGSRLWTV